MTQLDLHWDVIEHEGLGIYNEAYLANIRKDLKTAEKNGASVNIKFCYTIPAWCKKTENETDKETLQNYYLSAFQHAKRRLKNCSSVSSWTSE